MSDVETRRALPIHHTATSGAAWDGPANERRLRNDGSVTYYRQAYAWVDPEKDAETKAAYRFVHHQVSENGNIGAANIRACRTGIAVLNGARGGTTIPRADRKGVWNHLATHLKDAEVEPPPLRSEPIMPQPFMEARDFDARIWDPELRALISDDDSTATIAGRGARFSQWYDVGPFFKEQVDPNAFKKTLEGKPDIRGMFNHDPNFLLGRTRAGTMTVETDEKGMTYDIRGDLGDPQVLSVVTKIKRRDVDGSSMAFYVVKDLWEEDKEKKTLRRTLKEIQLIETGPVVFPAAKSTTAQVRSALASAGLDFDALSGVLMKYQTDIPLSSWDNTLVLHSIDVLQQLTIEPESTLHSVDDGNDPEPQEPSIEPESTLHSNLAKFERAESALQLLLHRATLMNSQRLAR